LQPFCPPPENSATTSHSFLPHRKRQLVGALVAVLLIFIAFQNSRYVYIRLLSVRTVDAY